MLRYLAVLAVMAITAVVMAMVSFQRDLPSLPDDPQNRGTFIFADTQDPGSLDPGKTSAAIDFRILKCVYQTLLVYEHGGDNLEPGVAESYEISEDGKTYTFHLRKNAKWSDGKPVTASDFVYAWRRAMLFETASDYVSLFYRIEGAEDFTYWRAGLIDYSGLDGIVPPEKLDDFKARNTDLEKLSKLSPQEKWDRTVQKFEESVAVKALDKRTLQVKLRSATPYFIELCAFPTFSPLPEAVIETHTIMGEDGSRRVDPKYWGDIKNKPVFNGPYVIERWETKRRLVLDQNPEYWDKDRMGNLRIVLEVIPDETLAVAKFRDGQVHWIAQISTPQLRAKLIEANYPHAHPIPRAGVEYYQFNCRPTLNNGRPNPMADARVRRALGMCIDRQKIVASVTRNNEPIAVVFVPEGQIPGYDSPIEAGLKYDPQAARKLLAEAGYPGGKGFPPIDLLINISGTSGGTNSDVALVIKKSWQDQLGLPDLNIQQPEFQVYLEESKQGNFGVRRAGWYGDYRDPMTWLEMLRTGDSNNDAEYSSSEYDKLLADATVEADADKRIQMLRKAEALLIQDAPIVPLYNPVSITVFDESKTDLRPNSWSNLRLDLIPVTRD